MVRYSPYQRALMSTANFAVPKTMDFAANREAIRSAQQTSAAVSRVTNFAFKQFDEALKVEGAQAGARAPKETLQRMQGGAPTSTFDKAAYASAVQVGSMQIESEARSELGKLMLEAKKTKMSPDVLRSQLDALIDGFSNSIQMLDPIAGARLSRRLGSAAQSVFLDRSEDYLNETQEKLDASMIGLVDNVGEQVQLIARQGGTQAFKNFNELITETADTMAANGVGPKKVQKFINESQDVYHKERAKGEFRRAVQNNKGQEYIDNFIKDQPRGKKQSKGIDGDTQSVLLRSWKAELNSQGGRYNRQLKTANKSLSDVLKGFKNGAGVKQDTFAELTNTASVINDPALTATTERVVKFIKDVQEQEEGGPQALAGLVASLEAKAAKSPGGKSTSILDLNFRDIAKARLRDMQTAIEKDPYGYRLRSLGKTYAPPALNSPFELEAHIKNQQMPLETPPIALSSIGDITAVEDYLKENIIGQRDAIASLVNSLKLMASGLAKHASFLFVGPTGVGKTQLAKLLGEKFSGNFYKINCAEYAGGHEYAKLIGSPPGYVGHTDKSFLAEKAEQSNRWVFLFDEVEKAHHKLYDFLLSLLDDGTCTDNLGTVLDFSESIFIFTSNQGIGDIKRESVGFNRSEEQVTDKVTGDVIRKSIKSHFSPEFLNRLDDLVLFTSLTK